MNSDEYKIITGFLNSGDLYGLREYLDENLHLEYLKGAREALADYMQDVYYKGEHADIRDGFLISRDQYSIFKFNTDEILTRAERRDYVLRSPKRQARLVSFDKSQRSAHIDKIEKGLPLLLSKQLTPVECVDRQDKYTCKLYTSEEGEPILIPQKEFKYVEPFLGEEVEYSADLDVPFCLVKSKKGYGILTGFKKGKKNK